MPSQVSLARGRALRAATVVLLLGAAGARGAEPPRKAAAPASPLARTFTPWDAPPPAPPPLTDELKALGERIFRGACVGCHGDKGDGQGREGKYLPIPPRDFVTAQFLCRHTPSGTLPRDEDLFRAVRRGFKSQVGMPAFKFLSDREVWAVIAFVKTLSPRWTTDEVPAPIVIPPPPPFDAKGVERGKAVYVATGCGKCHGPGGNGDGPSARTLQYDNEMPVRPADFSKPRDFKCGQRPQDVFRTLTNGMDGSPMPSFVEGLTDAQRWDLVQFILAVAAAGEAAEAAAAGAATAHRR